MKNQQRPLPIQAIRLLPKAGLCLLFFLLCLPCALYAASTEAINNSEKIAVSPWAANNTVEIFFSLLLVLFAIFFIAWALKKFPLFNATTQGVIKVKACLPLSTKEKLMIISIGQEHLLIGLSPKGMDMLKVLDDMPPVDAGSSSMMSFASIMKKHCQRLDDDKKNQTMPIE